MSGGIIISQMVKSLYIHIPFCRRKCDYCDFYSIEYQEGRARAYIDLLCKQIGGLEGEFSTIYIGGGTPTTLSVELWEKLLTALGRVSGNLREFTVEVNPESLDKLKAQLLRQGGVNRISLGVQSLSEQKLKKLGRIHSAEEALEKVFIAKEEGFDNISIDLIFGIWGEELNSWKNELGFAVKLPVTHISLYFLTYEKGVPLFKRVQSGQIKPLDEGIVAQMYEYNIDFLPKNKFYHYEVSNFAKKNYECRHNLNYWQNNSYLGLGPSAVSYLEGVRQKNTSGVDDYITKVEKGVSVAASGEKLSLIMKAKETAALKIRTKEGIEFEWFRAHTDFDFLKLESEALRGLIKDGLLRYRRRDGKNIGVALTKKGFLFCDRVSSDLM